MRWSAVLIHSLGINAIVGLASSFGHCQSSSQQPNGAAPKTHAIAIGSGPNPAPTVVMARPPNVRPLVIRPPLNGLTSPLEFGSAAVVGAPYSGTRTTTVLDGDRIILRSATRTFRDSHGRTRLERALPADTNLTSPMVTDLVTINDPVNRKIYTLQPQEKTADVSPLRDADASVIQAPVTPPTPTNVPPWGLPGVQESKPASLGEKFIDGIHVVGTRVEDTVTFADQEPVTIIIDQWFSPELGLAILTTHQGSDGVRSTVRLEHIVRAEPDAALFGVPPEYTRSAALLPSPHGPCMDSSCKH
jgi:hypothetical protein